MIERVVYTTGRVTLSAIAFAAVFTVSGSAIYSLAGPTIGHDWIGTIGLLALLQAGLIAGAVWDATKRNPRLSPYC